MAIDWNVVGMVAGTAFCGLLATLFLAHPLVRAAARIRSLPRVVQGALAALALVATLNAQKLRNGGGVQPEPPATVTQEEIAQGYRLLAETNETNHSFAMPTNAVYVGHLHEHGARSDFGMHTVDFSSWAFPCGTNSILCSRLWWFMDGRLQDAPRNPSFTASADLGDTLAKQGESRLWLLADGDERTVTWERFFSEGDTNRPVNAQISLRSDGDFTVRSNDLVRVYRRINPDDWDDDGYPNDEDPDPYVFVDGGFGPHQSLPVGANSNAYCWVEIVVSNANALVTFTGDGPSALPDPCFVAKAGETNRVTILIGKAYQVTCPMPIVSVGQSSYEIEVYQDQALPTEMYICWPVTIEAVEMRSGASFSMNVWPDWLVGHFAWTNSCCSVSGTGWTFTYSCGGTCTCTGCGALGYYGYESYRLPADGGPCGCGSELGEGDGGEEEDDGPYDAGASASFSKSAVIFEDRYENSPGVWVERQSTDTALHCVAHGGPNGGHVRFEIVGEEKLSHVSGISLPFESDVGAGNKIDFTIVYNGKQPSYTANDIVVTSTFTENVAGATQEVSSVRLTAFKVLLVAEVDAKENSCRSRHKYGVREKVEIVQTPSSPSLSWSQLGGGLVDGSKYQCPILAAQRPLLLASGNAEYKPLITVVEPSGIYVESVDEHRYGVPKGEAGGIGMFVGVSLQPFDVSFSKIAVEEIPCTSGSRTGYFEHPAFASLQSHTVENGAGRWLQPNANNYYGADEVCITSNIPRITPSGVLTNDTQFGWTHGEIFWDVPSGWGEAANAATRSPPVGTIPGNVTHRVVLFEDGLCGLRKFQHQVTRSTNDVVFLDGVQK